MPCSESPWFTDSETNPKATFRLFCFPYAGGGASSYYPWEERFKNGKVQLYRVQYPGRENRINESLITQLPIMIEELAPHIEKITESTHFAFYGHSMGAIIALELANLLFKRKKSTPAFVCLSGCNPPHLREPSRSIHNLPDDELIKEIESFGNLPKDISSNSELMQHFLPIFRADLKLLHHYSPTQNLTLECPLTVHGGKQDQTTSVNDLNEWKHYAKKDFTLRMFEGNHFFINPNRVSICNELEGLSITPHSNSLKDKYPSA